MNIKKNYTKYNAESWNKWASENCIWTQPIDHETYINAVNKKWDVILTPLRTVPKDWFVPFEGAKLLGLASGGAQQMPIFAALGADVTVFDLSEKQLKSEKMVSEREGYSINIVKGDMSKKFPFDDNSFDIIFHPVSNSYVEDVEHVWRECYRVLKRGGILLAGFSNPMIYLFEGNDTLEKLHVVNKLPYNPLNDCSEEELLKMSNDDSIQFSHSLETQIGGQLKAGLTLTDLYEDYHNEGVLAQYAPTFIATRAIKL